MEFVYVVIEELNGMNAIKNGKNLINTDTVHVDGNSRQSLPFGCDAL